MQKQSPDPHERRDRIQDSLKQILDETDLLQETILSHCNLESDPDVQQIIALVKGLQGSLARSIAVSEHLT